MTLYLGENLISGVATPVEGARNIGQIVQSTLPLNDAGLHLLDGALINGSGIYADFVTAIAELVTDYPDLFTDETTWQNSVTTYGVCGKFVYDSTANTVRLPKITGITEGTTDVTALGDLITAGLPNITGTWKGDYLTYSTATATGAFEVITGLNAVSTGNYGTSKGIGLDASLSNPIYGNSLTVQPQSIKVLYYIVLATSVKTDIEVDIDQVTTDLNGKADVDLRNATPIISFANAMNTVGIRTVVETSDPSLWPSWYRIYSDGWCEQGGELSSVNQDSTNTVSLLQSYINTEYSVLITATGGIRKNGYFMNCNAVQSRSTDSFIMRTQDYTFGRIWQACGYIR